MGNRIVVVGSSNTDMIVKLAHLPKPGETVSGGAFSTAAGGKGANQAVAAATNGRGDGHDPVRLEFLEGPWRDEPVDGDRPPAVLRQTAVHLAH